MWACHYRAAETIASADGAMGVSQNVHGVGHAFLQWWYTNNYRNIERGRPKEENNGDMR